MATVIILNPNEPDSFVRVRGALRNKGNMLTRIGALMVAGAQQAFRQQRFGSFEWPGRYPNQSEPVINVAGAVADFAGGASRPKARRFQRRPVLFDRGILRQTIASRNTGEDTVEVGTTTPYAATHQWGLVSTQPVNKDTKKRIAKWLLQDEAKPYRGKMRFLLQPNRSSLDTEVVQRPFLGVTPEMEDDIRRTVEMSIAEAAGGNA